MARVEPARRFGGYLVWPVGHPLSGFRHTASVSGKTTTVAVAPWKEKL